MTTLQYAALALGVLALAWDVYVIRRWGLKSGYTVSWETYQYAKVYPAIPCLAGMLALGAFPDQWVALLVGGVIGHIFGTMPTSNNDAGA